MPRQMLPFTEYAGLTLVGTYTTGFALVIPSQTEPAGVVRLRRRLYGLRIYGHQFTAEHGNGIIKAGDKLFYKWFTTWKQAVRYAAKTLKEEGRL